MFRIFKRSAYMKMLYQCYFSIWFFMSFEKLNNRHWSHYYSTITIVNIILESLIIVLHFLNNMKILEMDRADPLIKTPIIWKIALLSTDFAHSHQDLPKITPTWVNSRCDALLVLGHSQHLHTSNTHFFPSSPPKHPKVRFFGENSRAQIVGNRQEANFYTHQRSRIR
jgi:hypothetical protein